MASLNFRSIDVSLVSRKFLATCWVMVEAPTRRLSEPKLPIFWISAPATLIGSRPK
ncbi:uncharacterized protein METZ01_LOCUS492060 [marine metagenome]|uniref:Uncharacterized protein n=1 Tax=marine metagenome TaxID=408172 RepID=A0A383D3U7_9ZZZZ